MSTLQLVSQFDDPWRRDVSVATPTCSSCCCCCCLVSLVTSATLTAVHLDAVAARHGASPLRRRMVTALGALAFPVALVITTFSLFGLRLLFRGGGGPLPAVALGILFAILWALYQLASPRVAVQRSVPTPDPGHSGGSGSRAKGAPDRWAPGGRQGWAPPPPGQRAWAPAGQQSWALPGSPAKPVHPPLMALAVTVVTCLAFVAELFSVVALLKHGSIWAELLAIPLPIIGGILLKRHLARAASAS